MARRNISLPDDLDQRARSAGINVSALVQRALAEDLDRRRRMAELDAWLDELDAAHGAPSAAAMAEALRWRDSATRAGRAPTTQTFRSRVTKTAG